MKTVFDNKGVANAFAQKSSDYGRNQKSTMSFKDHSTFYSYRMPIAWRNAHGNLIVRSQEDSPSITTTSHIRTMRGAARGGRCDGKVLSGVPVKFYRSFGIGVDDILDYEDQSYRMKRVVFLRDSQKYTFIDLHTDLFQDGPLHVRNITPYRLVFRGDVNVNLTRISQVLVPDEYKPAAYDGWVAFTGQWLFVAQPDLDTRDIDDTVHKIPSLDDDHYASEGCGDYVRGVVRARGRDVSTLFSFNTDGRPSMASMWHRPIRPKIMPLPIGVGEDLTREEHLTDPSKVQ